MEDKQELLIAFGEISIDFNKIMKEIEDDEETYWNSLTKEQQLCCFNSVCRRIHKGDIEDKGSYRYVLYDVFGFGPESYGRAQLAGYLDIHNSFWYAEDEVNLLEAFAKAHNVPDPRTKAEQFLTKNL